MKIALITGVTRREGLGFETAMQMVDLGYNVIISGRDFTKVRVLAGELNASGMELDVTSEESIKDAASYVRENYGKLDALINNAGGYYDAGAQPLEINIEFAKSAFETNLFGALRVIKAFMPLHEESGSARIVNVSSGAGSFSDPIFGLSNNQSIAPVYSMTKLALNGLTVKIAGQINHSKIKINSVCPGFVATYPGTAEWGARPVNEGASGIVWAATLPDDGPTGGFFRDGKVLQW
ncbi:SDR family NAD(P)-dependent oxidoreductase [Flavobacterium pallidum]|uniref:Short-chain dehydrogenase n=1 Tax=Flavobacterium pallidum TaxID=2172098 RepID=A0A2S1SK61_9FLAO|nr:SDR family NAD(P)-dependent oxidoreductase [Flavobacterium pallidum]AWI26752.1 hypothetical protein HYN49_13085 [Flavobacterium pallidum]